MKDIFVPQEIAKKLKEIGFDEPCIAYYHLGNENDLVTIIKSKEELTDSFILGTFSQSNYAGISAPTYEQVFKWFREKGIIGEINFVFGQYSFSIRKYKNGENIHYHIEPLTEVRATYEEAREQTILKLIELYQTNSN